MRMLFSPGIILAFIVVWHEIEAKQCKYVLQDKRGHIKSTGYPSTYPDNLDCSWLINAPKGYTITLRTDSFRLDGKTPGCDNDALMIYDGKNSSAKSFDSPYCDRTAPVTLKSSGNVMFLRFTSDKYRSSSGYNDAYGFDIVYNVEPNCNQTINADNGTIKSPRYPEKYYSNANCQWIVTTRPGTVVIIEFTDFKMEGTSGGIDQCYDYTTIYDVIGSSEKPIGSYCGDKVPSTIQAKTNKIIIRLFADGTVTDRGFLITFSAKVAKKRHTMASPTTGWDISTTGKPLRGCNSTEFRCNNGVCLQKELRCNLRNDCGDHSDELNCAGRCSDRNGGCEHKCNSHPIWGSFCSCESGYQLAVNKKNCHDINECSRGNGGCGDVCTNFEGGFKCECSRNGFQIGPDGKTCQDVDECLEIRCAHKCENTVGSYRCTCGVGYRPTSSGRCIDKDECAIGVPSCYDCVNTMGSYRCNCDSGFVGINNATKCEDADECATNNGGCSQLCTNTFGSFHCHCRVGYTPQGFSGKACIDIDECTTFSIQCQHICVNTPGSYACACRSGFRLVNRTKCVNVNECDKLHLKQCPPKCLDSQGKGQNCTCPHGYELNSDAKMCEKQTSEHDCGIMGSPITSNISDRWTTATTNTWSWQAFLKIRFDVVNLDLNIHGCMATLINKQYLITTAHCLHFGSSQIAPSQLYVWFGLSKNNYLQQKSIKAEQIIVHPDYKKPGTIRRGDLALIKLSKPITPSTTIQPICMNPETNIKAGSDAYVINWGRVDDRRYAASLRQLRADIGNSSKCSWLRSRNYEIAKMYCAASLFQNKKACLPDSGSPLMAQNASTNKWYLYGMLVHGAKYPKARPCSPKYRGFAFYDLSKYKEWINENTSENS